MKKIVSLIAISALFIANFYSLSYAEHMSDEKGVMVGGALMVPSKDIVDNAVNSNDHTVLVDLVSHAGLVDVLKSDGPFTVFAPDNGAFNKLPNGIVKALKKEKWSKLLGLLLKYHVVAGAYTSDDLEDGMMLETVMGKKIVFTEFNGKWYANGAQITVSDVISSNGVTHVVDSLVLPGQKKKKGVKVGGALMVPSKDIVDNAVNSNDHTTVVAAVKAAGLVETLKSEGPFTVFAPTNMAFDKLPDGTVENLLKPENISELTNVLTYHVVAGAYTSRDIKDGMTLETVEGSKIEFSKVGNSWYINGEAKITIADVISSNGVTHVIDEVLIP